MPPEVAGGMENSADPDQTAPLEEEQSDQGLHCFLDLYV